jgi:ketosteroid isomerase-like protein
MTQGNIEIIRAIYSVFDDGPDAFLDRLDPSIEWVSPGDSIEPGTRRGHPGVRDAFAATAMAWDQPTHTLEELADTDDKVLATVTFRGRGRGSGMEAERTEFHLWTVRDDLVVRFEWFYQRAEALSAAGLPE